MDVLRPSLLPGLIHSLRHNVSRKNYDVALFEIGRVFRSADGHVRGYAEAAGTARTRLSALPLKNAVSRSRSPANAP